MLAGPTNIYRCADNITWKMPKGSLALTGHGEADEVRAYAEARALAGRDTDGG